MLFGRTYSNTSADQRTEMKAEEAPFPFALIICHISAKNLYLKCKVGLPFAEACP